MRVNYNTGLGCLVDDKSSIQLLLLLLLSGGASKGQITDKVRDLSDALLRTKNVEVLERVIERI